MDKQNIDQSVYERCVDAIVALFMEYYSATRAEDIHEKLASSEKIDVKFPAELDERCRVLIKKEHARRQRKQHLKSTLKGLRVVASIAVVLLALGSILFMSVEAVRIPIINFYIEQGGKYLEITSRDTEEREHDKGIDLENPLGGMIPEDYVLVMCDKDTLGSVTAIYDNFENGSIFFAIDPASAVRRIDTENAQIIREVQIFKYDGVIIHKDGTVIIAWEYEALEKTFTLTATALTEAEVIDIAEKFMQSVA